MGRTKGSGRKPLPTNIKLLRGNPGRRELNPNEARPMNRRLPVPPEHIQGEARKEWFRLGRKLYRLGLLTDIDLSAFGAYCDQYALWIEAKEQVRTYGTVLIAPKTGLFSQSPYLAIANGAVERMMKYLVEFGMTPSSRSRIQALPQEVAADPFEEFLNGGQNSN